MWQPQNRPHRRLGTGEESRPSGGGGLEARQQRRGGQQSQASGATRATTADARLEAAIERLAAYGYNEP